MQGLIITIVMGTRHMPRMNVHLASYCTVYILAFIIGSTHHTFGNSSSAGTFRCMKFMTWNASSIMSSGSYLGNALKQSDIDIIIIMWCFRTLAL